MPPPPVFVLRPDPTPLLAWFARMTADPVVVINEIEAGLAEHRWHDRAPLIGWPWLEALRRADKQTTANLLTQLGILLDGWESAWGLGDASSHSACAAAQAWLVQDLHCLADLHSHIGGSDAAVWSQRGHRAEERLHTQLWSSSLGTYCDRDAGGNLHPTASGDDWSVLLLLDTPPARVESLAKSCLAGLRDSRIPWSTRWLGCLGLHRHGRGAAARPIVAGWATAADEPWARQAQAVCLGMS